MMHDLTLSNPAEAMFIMALCLWGVSGLLQHILD